MSQLAGSDLTRQAIFLIEAGKMRPSQRTLDLIAAKTGKPAIYFTRGGSATPDASPRAPYHVEELESLCFQQQFDKVIALGEGMLRQHPRAPIEAYIRQYIGQALVRSGRPDEALGQLRQARAILEAEPDPWLLVECADWESCALYLKEDSRALRVAEEALRLCRSTQPRLPGTEARILEHIATIHVKNHSFEKAITYYEDALQAAGAVRDLSRMGRTYHGLSIAYQERGDLDRAVEFTHKALALYGLENDKALLARGENELGLLLMRQGQMARAEEAFRAALDHFTESGTERAKSHVMLSIGELQMKMRRQDEAMVSIKEAIELAVRLDEKLAISAGQQLLGHLHEAAGRRRLADRAFEEAMSLLREQGMKERLAETHASYAEILEARGNPALARKHWREAANQALRREVNQAGRLKSISTPSR